MTRNEVKFRFLKQRQEAREKITDDTLRSIMRGLAGLPGPETIVWPEREPCTGVVYANGRYLTPVVTE